MNRITKTNSKAQGGFSTVEMLIVALMSVIICAIAMPSYLKVASYLRSVGDLRGINGVTAQAKMRAAADFTHARFYANVATNTFHLEVWNKAANCWQTDGDAAACTGANSPVVALSQGVTFGTGGRTTGPTAGSAGMAQAPTCKQRAAGSVGGVGAATANTACIEFNSRGIPVDNTNAPVANGAIFINNPDSVESVTVSATGSIQSWLTSASCQGAACWHAQ